MVDGSEEQPQLPVPKKRGRPKGRLQDENYSRIYGGKPKFTAAEVRDALERNYGNPNLAADWLNEGEVVRGGTRTVSAASIRWHLDHRPSFKNIQTRGREQVLDLAESGLITRLRAHHPSLIAWTLARLGRERGYGPVAELVLDPAKLTVEQLIGLLDPARLRDDQLDGILEFLYERYGPKPAIGNGQIIESEPLPEPAPVTESR